MNFHELLVQKEIVQALEEQAIVEPTEIQAKTLPDALQGKDVIGISKTGSGKTLTFAIPMLQRLLPGKGLQGLVLVPVRELAEQVGKEIKKLAKYKNFNLAIIYGGVSLMPQSDALRRADIIVATPGRMLDHMERGNVNLSRVTFVVLDEADKMASMGFIEDVEKIISKTSKQRQTLLFGATISEEIARLKSRYMNNPITIKANAHVDTHLLNQFYYDLDMREKFSFLVHLLKKETPQRALVFCSTRHMADSLTKNLQNQKMDAQVIHGGVSQPSRLRTLEGFHKGRPIILVATAVAARGLDIKGVTHVFNYDLPKDPEEYVHQVGRTARAGASGKAITLLAQPDYDKFSKILQRFPVKVEKLQKEEFVQVMFEAGRRRFESNDHRRHDRFQRRERPQQRRWN